MRLISFLLVLMYSLWFYSLSHFVLNVHLTDVYSRCQLALSAVDTIMCTDSLPHYSMTVKGSHVVKCSQNRYSYHIETYIVVLFDVWNILHIFIVYYFIKEKNVKITAITCFMNLFLCSIIENYNYK